MLPIRSSHGLAAHIIAQALKSLHIFAATAFLAFPLLLVAVAFHSRSQAAGLVMSDGKAEVVPIESEPGLRAFVEAYLAAQNAKDVPKIKAMYHPKDLEAVAAFVTHQPVAPGQTRPTLDSLLLKAPFPQDHPPFLVQRYLKDSPLPQAGFRDWPVPPTHLIQSSYESKPDQYVTFMLHVAHFGTQWFVVDGVPSAEFIKKMAGGK